MAKKARKVRTDAEKEADFKRISAKKVNTIAKAARQLGSMASARYKYTPADVKQLAAYVQQEIEAAFDAFEGKKAANTGFEFK